MMEYKILGRLRVKDKIIVLRTSFPALDRRGAVKKTKSIIKEVSKFYKGESSFVRLFGHPEIHKDVYFRDGRVVI